MDTGRDKLSAEDRTRFWDFYSATYDALNHSIPYNKHMWLLVERMRLGPGESALDLGCGSGNLEMRLAKSAPSDARVLGLDFSEGMLSRARKKASRSSFSFQQADLANGIPLDDASVDVVVSNNFVYAISDKEALVAEIRRVLRPGGRVVVSDPKPDSDVPVIIRAHFAEISRMPEPRRTLQRLKTAFTLPVLGLPPILLSKFFIEDRRSDRYEFCTEDRWRDLFGEFESVEVTSVYADQSWLLEAEKGS